MHSALTAYTGRPDWFSNGVILPRTGRGIPYTAPMLRTLNNAIHDAGPGAQPGKVIAELSFGFWTNLIATRFQQSLWIPCLHRAFPNCRLASSAVHRRLETIQRLRNRVAHHERVMTSVNALYTGHSLNRLVSPSILVECASWVSLSSGGWIETGTRYKETQTLLRNLSARGIQFV